MERLQYKGKHNKHACTAIISRGVGRQRRWANWHCLLGCLKVRCQQLSSCHCIHRGLATWQCWHACSSHMEASSSRPLPHLGQALGSVPGECCLGSARRGHFICVYGHRYHWCTPASRVHTVRCSTSMVMLIGCSVHAQCASLHTSRTKEQDLQPG